MLLSGLEYDFEELTEKQNEKRHYDQHKIRQEASSYNSLLASTKQEVELLIRYRDLEKNQKTAFLELIKTIKKNDLKK